MTNPSLSEEAIFLAALEKATGPERVAYVAAACTGNDALRHRVLELLAGHDASRGPLDAPPVAVGATIDVGSERPGTQIGPYKLLQQIGEGGMGVVYMAEQSEPIARRVALKIIKPGMDTRQVIARFEAERQALSLMDHVNIARVLDAGTTEGGRPYFVMELVHGVPITKYCDDNRLTPRQRLELFVPVCQAIQHAHQKGIIHRDIKPTNVMVTLYDGKPVPKVIDFGVAKATEQKLTERTLFTQYGTLVGTLEYMSPEQAEMSALGADTRSDIYSLGVLLYELLTGSTPLTHQRIREAAYGEVLRLIKEEEPQRPSTRLSDSGEALASISANRHTEPAKLSKLMRGELDWIVMKCLEKDRGRRYETATSFAADVQRYLQDEPVQACPPSATYRFRKFARRNKGGLAMAALMLFFLVLLGSGVGWTVRDRGAREAEAARLHADRQAKTAGQVESILTEVDRLMREQKWPEALGAARQADAAAISGEANRSSAERVGALLKDLAFIDRLEQIRMQPATSVEGEFDFVAADQEYARAFRDYGVDVLELAVEASIDRLKPGSALVIPLAAALDDWVYNRRLASETDAADWKRLVAIARGIDPEPVRDRLRSTWGRAALETQDELRRLAGSIDIRAQHPATLVRLARPLTKTAQVGTGIHILRQAQNLYPGDFWLNYELGFALNQQQDHEGAIRFYTAAVSLRPKSAAAHLNLGNALSNQGKPDEAMGCCRKAIELDPKYAYAYYHLGIVLRNQGKLDEAITASRKAIELNPTNAGYYFGLGIDLRGQKKLDEANAAFDEAIAAYRKEIELYPRCANPYSGLGSALREQNKLDEAIAAYRTAIELDPTYANAYSGLGNALQDQRKLPEAIAAFRRAVELAPKVERIYFNFGTALRDQGKLPEAIAAFRKAIELAPTSPLATSAHFGLGQALAAQEKPDEAIAAYRKAIELDPNYTAAGAYINIGNILGQQNKLDEAVAAFRKAIELNQSYATVTAHLQLGQALSEQGKLDEAVAVYHKIIELRSDSPRTHNSLAWILATRPEANLRDPEQSVALAKRAVELKPEEGAYWTTLGAAHLRAGDWKEAIAALDKSMELRKGGNSKEWFFLTMAHWRLGEKDKAREWYDWAVQWMDKNKPKDDELRRFRSEAAELLGIMPEP